MFASISHQCFPSESPCDAFGTSISPVETGTVWSRLEGVRGDRYRQTVSFGTETLRLGKIGSSEVFWRSLCAADGSVGNAIGYDRARLSLWPHASNRVLNRLAPLWVGRKTNDNNWYKLS